MCACMLTMRACHATRILAGTQAYTCTHTGGFRKLASAGTPPGEAQRAKIDHPPWGRVQGDLLT